MENYKWAPSITSIIGKRLNHLLPLYPNRKWFNVKDLHDEIESIGQHNDLTSVVTTVCQLCEIEPDTRISLQYISEAKKAFENEMKENTGSALAEWLTGKFFASIELREVYTVEQFLHETARIYSEIAKLWYPIMANFAEGFINPCKIEGVTKLNVMARDANPIYVIINRMKEKEQFDLDIELAELSRRVFQIYDEIAEEGKPSELASAVVMDARELAVAKYLDRLFKGKSACVDMMCYGTVLMELLTRGKIYPKPLPFLFISNNNDISGFLNTEVEYAYHRYGKKIPDEFLTILGDTVESFPKPYKNVEVTMNQHGDVELLAEPVDIVSTSCAFVIYWTLYKCDSRPSEPLTELENLYRLHRTIISGREQIPALLPYSVPKWSKRKEFRIEWHEKLGPLPPKRQ